MAVAVVVVVVVVVVAPREGMEGHRPEAGWLREFDVGGQRPRAVGSDLDKSIHYHGRSGLGVALLLARAATGSLPEALLTLGCIPNSCWRSFTCRVASSTSSGLRGGTSGSTTTGVFFSSTGKGRPVTPSCKRVYHTFSPTARVP